MELEYASDKVKAQCTSVKAAKKLFGGDMVLATCLLARVNALENADTMMLNQDESSGVLFFSRLMKVKIHLPHVI